jgi:Fur family transcriptional regulator, ferric uptake regulator
MPRRSANPKQLELIRKQIRAAGLRLTNARLCVMQELIAATNPLSHGDVAKRLASKGFDRATIYRNLVELTEAGIVSRIELGDHVWRFELRRAEGDASGEHPHFVCVDCGEVSCMPNGSVSIKRISTAKNDVIREVTEVLLKGHCGNCA